MPSVPETADVQQIAELMMSTGVKSIPVTRDGRLAGLLSRRDLLGVPARSDRRIAADGAIAWILAATVPGVRGVEMTTGPRMPTGR